MMFSSIIGVNIFIYAVIGFIIGMTNKMYIEDDLIFPTMTIAIGDIIYGVLFYVLKFLLRGRLFN
jgi:rod shape-determining protein MreD